VRVLPGGVVDFVGRVDDQVKIHGYRIELGEVQAVLLDHRSVREAVVLAVGPVGDKRLVAYCVPVDGPLPPAAELVTHCSAVLPEYMVPSAFVAVERMPLNANGKVDRAALPVPDAEDTGSVFVAPRTAVEERIAGVWRAVLGRDQIGVFDSFFDLGGHSIRAVALVGKLRAAGFDVAVRDVFQHRTVAELAQALSGQVEPVDAVGVVAPFALLGDEDKAKLPEGVVDAYPLSQVQLGMVIEMLAEEGNNRYHNTNFFLIRDEEPFWPPALRAAARLVVERHELLRTSFDLTTYTVPMQLVHPDAQMRVEVVDVRHLDEAGRESALRELVAKEREALFDLDRPPLLRMAAFVESNDTWRLGFTQCHAITEGWSQQSLLMEVLDLYRQIAAGRTPEQPALPAVRYADFIAGELESLASAEDRGYWQRIVSDYAS
jgi:aryl carrier-like protein